MKRAAHLVVVGATVLAVGASCGTSAPTDAPTPTTFPSPASPTSGGSSAPGTASVDRGPTSEPGAPAETDPPLADFDRAYGDAQPVNVSVALSPITFTTTVTTENGGYVSLLGSDGTFYELLVPADAVLSDIDITMTVVSSIRGSPLGDTLVGAVELQPSGLRLIHPATLTIRPTTPVAVEAEGPFSADSDGANLHLFPLDPDPSVLRMHLLHFSIFGLFLTDDERREQMITRTAVSVERQLAQELARLIGDARYRHYTEGDGELDPAEVERVVNYFRDRVVRPMLALAEHDHRLFIRAFRRWTSWERQRQLLLGEDYELDAELLASARRAFANYIEHTKERCYEHDLGSIYDLMALTKEAQLHGQLLDLEAGEAFEFVLKCATFTVEMDSTMDVALNTCMFIDAGASDVEETSRVTTSVLIDGLREGPWSAPIQWQEASGSAECVLPARGGGSLIECEMTVAGFADADEFAVVGIDFELNNVNRPTPPPPPPPNASLAPSGSAPASPSRPPTPRPTEPPEETISELRLRSLLVQPGDPQVFYDGDCQVFGFSGGSETTRGSGMWLAGWKDNSAPVGRRFVNHPEFGEAWLLTGWEYIGEGDLLAQLEYDGGSSGMFGSTDEETTFVLRHTPQR